MSAMFRKPALFRLAMSWYPPYWGSGVRVAAVSADFRRVEVQMRQHWLNRNVFGTHFGGSLYAMCDPFYVLQLVALLGEDYLIWDKSARIEFLRPGRGTVQAVFTWDQAQLDEIRDRTARGEKHEPERVVEIRDAQDALVARVHKTLYVRRKKRAR